MCTLPYTFSEPVGDVKVFMERRSDKRIIYFANQCDSQGKLTVGTFADGGKIRELAEKNKTAKIKDDRARTAAEEAKKKFSGKIVVLKAKAGEGGKLFGSITSGDVAEAILAQYGVTVDKKDVKAEEAVKMLGDYKAKAKLYNGIEAEFTLRVEGE